MARDRVIWKATTFRIAGSRVIVGHRAGLGKTDLPRIYADQEKQSFTMGQEKMW
jgi:hypothetical protein